MSKEIDPKIEEIRAFMNKMDVWIEEDSVRFKKAAAYLKLQLNEGAIAGRRNGYAAAMQDVFQNPEKYGFKKL